MHSFSPSALFLIPSLPDAEGLNHSHTLSLLTQRKNIKQLLPRSFCSLRVCVRVRASACTRADRIINAAFIFFKRRSMLLVCKQETRTLRVRAVRYARDRVQSQATERKERERGELMREQGGIHPAPIDNLTPHLRHTCTLAPFCSLL